MKRFSNSTVRSLSRDRDGARRWFADLLWAAFPAPSEGAVARRAAPVLRVSERQVRHWLREDHDAAARHIFAVLAIAGAEIVFARVGRQVRAVWHILGRLSEVRADRLHQRVARLRLRAAEYFARSRGEP